MATFLHHHAVRKADAAVAQGKATAGCKTGVRGKGRYRTWTAPMLLRASSLSQDLGNMVSGSIGVKS